jgi:ABC-type transport system involved in cytochrome c biogenesis permease subunit
MLPLYPDLPTTATAFWVGIVVAVVHYILRRRVVELFGVGFGLIIAGSTVQWWGQGIIATFGVLVGFVGISYLVVSAIILVLKAVQYSADVLSRTVVHSAETQGQRLLECRCTCQ